ncbi:hypothetical protein Dimus_021290 [Dionaea muscipula]
MASDSSATTSLAPGFRFHPTDEELVSYYLRRKLSGRPFRFDAIGDIDIYKTEPWILPGLSKLKTRDLEWYFFSVLDKKYGNGSRTNRATEEGYWKTTGKDRAVHHKGRVVGMKKTLVFHRGRAPRGERTNWVMHEYRSIDEELEKAGIPQDGFVLCRIFQKSGAGPRNGEKYGAPLLDEEWEDDNIVAMVPGSVGSDEILVDDAFVEQDFSDQGLDVEFLMNDPPAFTLIQEDGCNSVEIPGNLSSGNEQKPLIEMLENPLTLEFDNDDQNFFHLPFQLEGDTNTVKNEYPPPEDGNNSNNPASAWPTEPTQEADTDAPYAHDQPPQDSVCNALSDDGLFLEANDLSEPADSNPSDLDLLEQYLAYFDAEDDIVNYLSFNSPERLDAEICLPDQAVFTEKNLTEITRLPSYGQQAPEAADSSSSSKPKSISDLHYPIMSNQVNRLLGNIPAPPAFASELPTKAMTARLNAATPSSDPVHVTAGMVRIRDMTLSGNAVQWSLDKLGNVNVIVSFDVPESLGLASSGKIASAVSRGWFCFLFFWVLVLAVSVKIGTCIYAK